MQLVSRHQQHHQRRPAWRRLASSAAALAVVWAAVPAQAQTAAPAPTQDQAKAQAQAQAQVRAMSFAETMVAARGFDAQFRAAAFELESVRQGVPIARASLLPQVALNASRSDVSGSRQFFNSAEQEAKVQVGYATPQASLSLRMPLYNKEALSRYDEAQARLEGAESLYRTRGLDLADRAGAAYLQVLLGESNVALAEQQLVAVKGQLARSDQRLARGEGTRTEQAQARAAVDLGQVRLIEANNDLENARRGLKRVTGVDTPRLNQIPADFSPGEIVPNRLFDWLEQAARNNPTIQARQQAVVAARFGIQRQTAGHYPRVDLVASIARSENESLSNLGQTSVLKSLGVQLNVPLYSGGGVDASVKQAVADRARSEEELRSEREGVEVDLQRYFQDVSNGTVKAAAYRRAVESSEVAYRGAVRAQEAGLGTTADVLDAQALLYAAQRDWARARYDYLLSRLRLMALAGQPVDDLVADIDRQLSLRRSAP